MSAAYPGLFSPVALGTLTLRNRVALPATLTNYGAGSRITDRWIDFLVERARGGAGLIVTEIVAVDPEAVAHDAIVTGYDDRNDAGFARLADEVHRAGAAVVAQLWHPGRQQLWRPTRSPMGVSDQPDALSWTVPHVMDTDEIRRLVESYVDVASRLQRAGLDGIELHGAHGYLITQFLSPWSNDREDDYGGSRENRLRFCREITSGIRERCGDDFVVGLKMPADEGVEGGIDPAEAAAITAALRSSGCLDYFAYGQGNFSLSLENHVPDLYFRPGHFLHLHRRMREAAGDVPVMALGRIDAPDLAEEAIVSGAADLVGMSRALIADAAFPAKAERGAADDIRRSPFDNYCWGEVHAGRPLREVHNPQLGTAGEADWSPRRADRPCRVVVVGGGPSGLEAAWVAAARGHRVTLLGTSPEAGGKLRLEAGLPGRGAMARIITHQLRQAEHHGVELRLGVAATADSIAQLDPEAIVLACGATPRAPTLGARTRPSTLLSAHAYMRDWPSLEGVFGRTALVLDHDHGAATYAVADTLARHHRHVIIATPRTHIAGSVNYCSAIGVHRRLHQAEVEVLVATELVDYHESIVTCRDVFTGRERCIAEIDLVVYATPRRANDELSRALAQHLPETQRHLVGDCLAPRNLMIAIHEGHALGNAL